MNKPHTISKITSNTHLKNNKKISTNSIFGPNLKESKPLKVKCGHIKKLIHYDSKKKDDSEDDIPDENFKPIPKCEKCGHQLNDAGQCPVCDLGDKTALDEALESLTEEQKINLKELLKELD